MARARLHDDVGGKITKKNNKSTSLRARENQQAWHYEWSPTILEHSNHGVLCRVLCLVYSAKHNRGLVDNDVRDKHSLDGDDKENIPFTGKMTRAFSETKTRQFVGEWAGPIVVTELRTE